MDSDTILIGAKNKAYIYKKSGADWKETKIFTGKEEDGAFGNAVAIEGDIILIADKLANKGGDDTGAVYPYVYKNDKWEGMAVGE